MRPRWYVELALVAVGYAGYAAVRNARGEAHHPAAAAHALANAEHVIRFERAVGLFHELRVQELAIRFPWLVRGADVYYASAHFIVTAAVLIWLFLRAPLRYRLLRTALGVSTAIAL